MADELIARFRRWFDYECEMHAKILESLETVPPNRRTSPEYCRAIAIFGHIVGARAIWLWRLGVSSTAPTSLAFDENADLGRITAMLKETENAWSGYLSQLTDTDLAREFEYQSLDGGGFRNRVEDILTQLFGHSWYHRGQIAMLVRAAGGTPAITDFIYWCREPVRA